MLDFRNPEERAVVMNIHKSSAKDRESMRDFDGVVRAYLATTKSSEDAWFMWFAIQDTDPKKKQYDGKFIRMKFTDRGKETLHKLLETWGVAFTGNLEDDVAELSPVLCPVDLVFYKAEMTCRETGEPRTEQRVRTRRLPRKWWPGNISGDA